MELDETTLDLVGTPPPCGQNHVDWQNMNLQDERAVVFGVIAQWVANFAEKLPSPSASHLESRAKDVGRAIRIGIDEFLKPCSSPSETPPVSRTAS